MSKYNDTGGLFKNDKKETDKHPDYRGSCFVGGVEYWISSWINKDKNGNKYMSLKFNQKDESFKDLKEKHNLQTTVDNNFFDDVPF